MLCACLPACLPRYMCVLCNRVSHSVANAHIHKHSISLSLCLCLWVCMKYCAYVCIVVFIMFCISHRCFWSKNSFASLHHSLDHMRGVYFSSAVFFLFLRKNKVILIFFDVVHECLSVSVSVSVCSFLFQSFHSHESQFFCLLLNCCC